jgi:hypothetical protein
MASVDDVHARSDNAIRRSSAWWLATAHWLLRDRARRQPLTDAERAKLQMIIKEMQAREMPT